jgi:hypothetical protein
MRRIAQGLYTSEMAFQQQAGGLQHILIVVGDQDSGIDRRHQGTVRKRTGVRLCVRWRADIGQY